MIDLEGLEGIAKALRTDLSKGLSGNDNAERRSEFGSNMRPPTKARSLCKIIADVLEDLLLRVLIACGIISIVINMITEDDKSIAWIDGVGIIVAVVIVTFVSAFNDYQKEKQFRELNKKAEQSKKIQYLKNGVLKTKHEEKIVVGDVLVIQTGKSIPADGLLIIGKGVECDESSMTGESIGCKKDTLKECMEKLQQMKNEGRVIDDSSLHEIPSPLILSGSQIKEGEGLFLVIAVGKNSCVGKVLKSLRENPTFTPLQKKLNGVAGFIGKIGLYTAILTVAVLFIRWIISSAVYDTWSTSDIGRCFKFLILGITVLIVAIPEGLPLAVTIALAYSVTKMFNENNLVKTLMSCEVMGNANYICSDKTGTLTKNEMDIVKLWYGGDDIIIDVDKEVEDLTDRIDQKGVTMIFESLACNISKSKKGGNATEEACLKLMKRSNCNHEELQDKYKIINRFFFNSKRKKMSTIVEIDEGTHRLFIKGAPEKILNCSTSYHCGEVRKPLDSALKQELENTISSYNKQALRTIAVAYKDLKPNEYGLQHDEVNTNGDHKAEEEDLVLVCAVGIRDTLRLGVEQAVSQCHRAGISVIMVTGDNIMTGRTIAENCKIIDVNKEGFDYEAAIMDGETFSNKLGGLIKFCTNCDEAIDEGELEKYKNELQLEAKKKKVKVAEEKKDSDDGEVDEDDDLEKHEIQDVCPKCKKKKVIEKVKNLEIFKEKIYPHVAVIARSRPLDKLLLVTALKELGNTVAVTGDGTNDAPALKKADVGFAMGMAGTDIAKTAADIILLDDNFASIITAVKWGRNIYDSIQKFIQFQLSVNIVALVVAFIGSCVVSESPLTALQLIWINIIMDSLASLALATDPPTLKLLNRAPYSKSENIISKKMMKHILGQSAYMVIVILIILFAGEYFIPEEDEYVNGIPIARNGYIRTGRSAYYSGNTDDDNLQNTQIYTKAIYDEIGPSRHYTVLFTTFVFLQIVNEWNCRKLYDEVNIFEGIHKNYISIAVRIAETAVQVIISQFGGRVFSIYKDGMTWYQWLICIAFSLGSFIIRLILVMIPEDGLKAYGNSQVRPISDHSLLSKRSASFHRRASLPESVILRNLRNEQ
jgi:Ca2+ transporting ATPase